MLEGLADSRPRRDLLAFLGVAVDLAERQAEFETRAAELEATTRSLDVILANAENTGDAGLSYEVLQIKQLREGVDILVATPGRLLDHVGQGTLDLSSVEILVLDEADRMLDMGFIKDIRRVLALLPKKRQNLLFSATFSEDIKDLADSLLDAPALIEVARRKDHFK